MLCYRQERIRSPTVLLWSRTVARAVPLAYRRGRSLRYGSTPILSHPLDRSHAQQHQSVPLVIFRSEGLRERVTRNELRVDLLDPHDSILDGLAWDPFFWRQVQFVIPTSTPNIQKKSLGEKGSPGGKQSSLPIQFA